MISCKRLPKRFTFSKKFVRIFACMVVALITNAAVRGQGGSSPAEPNSPSILYYLDSSAQLVSLESRLIQGKRKYHALGFSGVTIVYQLEGEKSSVRLKADSRPEFVVRLTGDVDPLETVQFYRFERLNSSRVVTIEDVDAFSRVTKDSISSATVDFNAAKYGSASYRIVPVQTLKPGEYCLMVRLATKWQWNGRGFCFGVDAAGK